jgi:hypothetical protein
MLVVCLSAVRLPSSKAAQHEIAQLASKKV